MREVGNNIKHNEMHPQQKNKIFKIGNEHVKEIRSVWYNKIRQNTCKRDTKARIVKDELSTNITEDMYISLNVWSEKKE
jgi:hypothetical protein